MSALTNRLLALLGLGTITLALAGCPGGPGPGVVAVVDGEEITAEGLQLYLETNAGLDSAGLPAAVLSSMLDQLLDEELLLRLARARGFDGDADRRAAVDQLLASESARPADAAEVEAFYRNHPEEFQRSERVRLRQILVPDEESARKALDALAAGRDFAEVAREMSTDPAAAYGGEQGELAREDVPRLFVEEVFALEAGEHSGIVRAPHGFHIFQVVERQPAEVLPLAAAAAEIRARLESDAADRSLARLLAEARSRYTVEVYVGHLPFDYQGRYREPSSPPSA